MKDGNFYYKKQIIDIKRRLNPIIFTLKAGLSVCIERDKNRKSLGKEAVKAVYKKSFDYGIIINANKSKKEIIKEILTIFQSP